MRKFGIGIVVCVLGMYSCKSEFAEPADAGYSFFQIEQGHYIAYDVDSIVFDIPSGIQDTFHYQVKEYIDSMFTDLEGRPTARIERSYRNTNVDPWVLKKIWVANRTQTTAEKVEENVRFIKMVFPVNAEVEWNGNVQNTFSTWNYHYEDIDAMMNVGSLTFPRTVTVNQRNVSNLIQREFAEEIYAYDVGMVYKQLDTLKYTLSGGIQTLRTGIKFKMTAFEYGEE
jgi:hypothetical protein